MKNIKFNTGPLNFNDFFLSWPAKHISIRPKFHGEFNDDVCLFPIGKCYTMLLHVSYSVRSLGTQSCDIKYPALYSLSTMHCDSKYPILCIH